jgi:hypothetical protein
MTIKINLYSICKPHDFQKYKHIDLNSLLVFVIDFLEKNDIPLSFENICVATFKMFPKKFSLMDYEEFPDATRVNRVLLHLRPKYENLVDGNVKTGFTLTEKGKLRVQTTKDLLEQKGQSENKETRPKLEEKQIEEIKNSIAFNKFKQKKFEEVQIEDIYGFLLATPYTPKKDIRKFLNTIISIAEDKNDADILNFLKIVKEKFGAYFQDKGD